MKVAFIVGSPKAKNSTSEKLLQALSDRLPKADIEWVFTNDLSEDDLIDETSKIPKNDVIVIAFPVYIDSIPSHLLKFLRKLQKACRKSESSARVYCIANCGFYEPANADVAIDMVKLWISYSKLVLGRAIALGAGGIVHGQTIGEGALQNYGLALDELASNIMADEGGETLYFTPNISQSQYISDSHKAWENAAKKRGLSVKDLRNRFG